MIEIKAAALGLSAAAEPIIRALPQWFGLETTIQTYVAQVGQHPTFLAVESEQEDTAVGFLTMIQHSPTAAEIYVMGVKPGCHRKGIGRSLVRAVEAHLHAQGVKFLQVKTVSDEYPDESYKRTRAFYKAMGFTLLEEFPDLWGPLNPCWQLIKKL